MRPSIPLMSRVSCDSRRSCSVAWVASCSCSRLVCFMRRTHSNARSSSSLPMRWARSRQRRSPSSSSARRRCMRRPSSRTRASCTLARARASLASRMAALTRASWFSICLTIESIREAKPLVQRKNMLMGEGPPCPAFIRRLEEHKSRRCASPGRAAGKRSVGGELGLLGACARAARPARLHLHPMQADGQETPSGLRGAYAGLRLASSSVSIFAFTVRQSRPRRRAASS